MTRDPAFLEECQDLKRQVERFETLERLRGSADWPRIDARLRALLATVRRHEPAAAPPPSPDPSRVKAVHWNIEHGNWYEQVEAALLHDSDLADADVLLFNEIDFGMARAGNRDVAADLAASLKRYAVWAPFFLETTPGRDDDPRMAAGRVNQESLFGVAILSRWPIGEVRLIELPSPEHYQFDIERMIGRHVALVAEILRPEGAFLAVSAHLEVHRTRSMRARQMRIVLEALRDEQRPVVIAGDFNSHTFDRGRPWDPFLGAIVLMMWPTPMLARRLLHPDRGGTRERVFDELARHRFAWQPFVDRRPTLQLRLTRIDELNAFPRLVQQIGHRVFAWAERRGKLRLDWFAGRGWSGGRGLTVQDFDGPNKASDHAPLVAWFEERSADPRRNDA
jgi:endonuclease/exonuclease/phosphatase family metal-dependent hydrolase